MRNQRTAFVFAFLTFFVCVLIENLSFYLTFQRSIFQNLSFLKLAVFRHQIMWHDVTKTPYSQSFSTNFAENLWEDIKLMPNTAPWVWRLYLPSFLSHWKSLLGKAYNTPSPSQWRVKSHVGVYFLTHIILQSRVVCDKILVANSRWF